MFFLLFSWKFQLSPLSLGSHWHNGYEEDRRLPLDADDSGESASDDSGHHRKRPCPRPDWAYLLAVHKREPRTQTQVSANTQSSLLTHLKVTHCRYDCNLTVEVITPSVCKDLKLLFIHTLRSLSWSVTLCSALLMWCSAVFRALSVL